ncbi:hypothetical protein CSC81_17110, partial [Tenacibaculum discolor]
LTVGGRDHAGRQTRKEARARAECTATTGRDVFDVARAGHARAHVAGRVGYAQAGGHAVAQLPPHAAQGAVGRVGERRAAGRGVDGLASPPAGPATAGAHG